ncbi:MAG: glycoside hydrolase family 16 protein, partial [Planctomycetota bacterium]
MKSVYRFLMVTGFICGLMVFQGCRSTLKTPENPQFTLEWEDHFDAFDPSRWEKATHTWESNLAQFVQENVTFQDGTMRLHLKRQETEKKDYTGAEYRTKEKFLYGRYVVSAKFPKGSGIV